VKTTEIIYSVYIVIKSNTYPMSGGRKHHLPSKCHWDD